MACFIMKLGIILSTNEPETCWNALRLGVFARKQKDEVRVFLLGQGVEIEKVGTERFDVAGMARQLLDAGGSVLACGTCLKLRESEGSELCPLSTMADLYQIIAESDKVLTF